MRVGREAPSDEGPSVAQYERQMIFKLAQVHQAGK
jgi:hypothetical protein